MSKYCPAGKIECGLHIINWSRDFCDGELCVQGFEECPWPSKQKPVKDNNIEKMHIDRYWTPRDTIIKLNEVIDRINEITDDLKLKEEA